MGTPQTPHHETTAGRHNGGMPTTLAASSAPAGHAAAVRYLVGEWFAQHRRELPWREPGCSPWGVLVSEIMLQQTPVVRVLPRWLEWMDRWPDPAALAEAPTADVLRAWGRLGYPRRALRLQECARALVAEHEGAVPADEESLLALPGIGTYTAAAVLSFAFHRRATVLDTNVRRVLARVFDGMALPPPHLSRVERDRADALVPADPEDAAVWAAASMELGALVCTARSPQCQDCPVVRLCAWNRAGLPPDEHSHLRRRQAWHGTDRQTRGAVMALLRSEGTFSHGQLIARIEAPAGQVDRCLLGLCSDGLAVRVEAEGTRYYRLPE